MFTSLLADHSAHRYHPLVPTQFSVATLQPSPPRLMHRAFVTSTSYAGNLGGVAGADAKCAARAAAGDLPFPEDFKALLCVPGSGSPAAAAHTRFPLGGPLYRTGVVRGGFADLDAVGESHQVACPDGGGTDCVSRYAVLRDAAHPCVVTKAACVSPNPVPYWAVHHGRYRLRTTSLAIV